MKVSPESVEREKPACYTEKNIKIDLATVWGKIR